MISLLFIIIHAREKSSIGRYGKMKIVPLTQIHIERSNQIVPYFEVEQVEIIIRKRYAIVLNNRLKYQVQLYVLSLIFEDNISIVFYRRTRDRVNYSTSR